MTQYGIQIALAEIVALRVVTQQTQFAEQGDERSHRRLCQRISGGDVHLLHLVRNTMDHSRQQRLVAQHHRRLAASLYASVPAQPLTDVPCLRILGGR